jgi:hypothetical protein
MKSYESNKTHRTTVMPSTDGRDVPVDVSSMRKDLRNIDKSHTKENP